MPAAAGVVGEKGSECPHWAERVGRAPPGGVWVRVWSSSRLYYLFLVRVWANVKFCVLKI